MPTETDTVSQIDCHTIGSTVVALGGGRRKMGDPVDPAVGVEILVRVGDRVSAGQPILHLLCHSHQKNDYLDSLGRVVVIQDEAVQPRPLVFDAAGV